MPEPEATQHSNAMKRYRASKQSRDVVITAEVRGKRKDAEKIGTHLAEQMLTLGADKILASLESLAR